jgi:excisionase family DNA binding protein
MSVPTQLPRLLTVEEFCDSTGLSKANAYKQVRLGRLPAVRIGRAVRISAAAAQEWIESGGSPIVDPGGDA